jgi:hypothetical protein
MTPTHGTSGQPSTTTAASAAGSGPPALSASLTLSPGSPRTTPRPSCPRFTCPFPPSALIPTSLDMALQVPTSHTIATTQATPAVPSKVIHPIPTVSDSIPSSTGIPVSAPFTTSQLPATGDLLEASSTPQRTQPTRRSTLTTTCSPNITSSSAPPKASYGKQAHVRSLPALPKAYPVLLYPRVPVQTLSGSFPSPNFPKIVMLPIPLSPSLIARKNLNSAIKITTLLR